ncbi:MAG: Bax inhibitor-1/YccA family protein [Barnesiella sp.]|nr:Bax inhibitor-1/YccA family protein [Barnesiella sp.]MDE6081871.1 Bax inhibitor-1/YccA family protein [Muribaculaceae bacterium]
MNEYNYKNQYPYGGAPASQNAISLSEQVSKIMRGVYLKMFFALLVTALTAYGMMLILPEVTSFIATHRWVYWGLLIGEIGLVMAISGGINKFSVTTCSLLFYLYAIVNGAVFSVILGIFDPISVVKTFLLTAGTFGAMSVYGYTTHRDLSKIGSILTMALFGLIICLVVNIFWYNSVFDIIVSFLGVIIFIGLTAWDTQKIKRIAEANPYATDGRLATIGALTLYLDFINLFLYLLRIFGSSRN